MHGTRVTAASTITSGLGAVAARARIVVAMSGGVDSSVVAALLSAEGHDVVGVTLQLYDHGKASGRAGACCAGRDIHDARRVAERLDIPHYVLDFQDRFRRAVIDDFAAAYAEGRTPIPCVRCNERVKFGDLLAIAEDLGADALATGHYVRRVEGAAGPELHSASDDARDQSYFLFATTREQLARLCFPLGELPKSTTRELARDLALPVADKPDSQDICFVPEGSHADLVARLRPDVADPGEIVDSDGRVLGRHRGIARYTVGQRRGLGVAAGERRYVLRIEPEARRVVIGPRAAGACTAIELADVNWLGEGERPRSGQMVNARHRANEDAVPARLVADGPITRVLFDSPQYGVAPGQACALYDGTRVLGGGWIAQAPLVSDARSAAIGLGGEP